MLPWPNAELEELLREIIASGAEGPKVDFKRELLIGTASQKVESAIDVSAIANTDAENDVQKGYGFVMDTFPIVRRNDEKAHGEYRTKSVILEIYDEMAEAVRTGKPYQTRLDPPPADPRVAHPDTRGVE